MGLIDQFRTRLMEAQAIGRMGPGVARTFLFPGNASTLLAEQVSKRGDAIGLRYLERSYSWREINAEVNRYARAFQHIGVHREDAVPLLMDNRPEFLFSVIALTRIGAIAALINTNISGKALAHAISCVDPVRVLVGSEHADKLREALPSIDVLDASHIYAQADDGDEGDDAPEAFGDFDELTRAASPRSPVGKESPGAEDRMCYIYTSGTTGLPKAAIISNRRWQAAAAMFGSGILAAGPDDTIYMTLPLYHSNGMFGGVGASLTTGATLALRRKFSASGFWDDVRRFNATSFVYIGELCRYLLNQPPRPDDREHRLRVATGNGLRPDIWREFQERFGIPQIREFYGATEGNAALVNFAGRPGMVGRMQPGQALVRCDLATGEVLRDRHGHCEALTAGETGLLVGRISRALSFDGYLDREASDKKILRDVFSEGDQYFNTGDLLTLHEDSWLSFADRIGDTFRWKGENVSTNEVAEILNGAPGVLESNVYGVAVPGAEGRAGMASLNVDADFSIDAFAAYAERELPVFQRPYFLRLQKDMRITGTFKHQKTDYREEGYDPSRTSDPLYMFDGKAYVPLDAALFEKLQSGSIALR